MQDRENVIKESEEAIDILAKAEEPTFWLDFVRCAFENALAMLKEQEPVKPDGENCGECGYTLHRINYYGPDKELRHEWFRFCPSCGKAVKWDD